LTQWRAATVLTVFVHALLRKELLADRKAAAHGETAEAVPSAPRTPATQLKLGVNENAAVHWKKTEEL
jgi:hypothetical protein